MKVLPYRNGQAFPWWYGLSKICILPADVRLHQSQDIRKLFPGHSKILEESLFIHCQFSLYKRVVFSGHRTGGKNVMHPNCAPPDPPLISKNWPYTSNRKSWCSGHHFGAARATSCGPCVRAYPWLYSNWVVARIVVRCAPPIQF